MKYKVTLNNRTYEVEVEEGEAMLVDEYEAYAPAVAAPAPAAPVQVAAAAPAPAPAAPAQAVAAGEAIKSPMPGNILQIKVSQGQHVNEGDVVIILEAMKMENEIMAPHDATVVQVLTDVGTKVDTGTPILVLG